MKSKKIVLVLLMIISLMSVLATNVFAADSFSATLTPSTTRIAKGGEFTVTLKLSSINVQSGISAVEGTLKYDSDVLSITKNDIKAAEGWAIEFDEDTLKFEIDRSDSVSTDCEIATFKFKVNSNTSNSTATVSAVSVAAGNASITEKVKITDIVTNVTIASSATAIPSTQPSSQPTSQPSSQPSQSSTPTSSPSQNQVSNMVQNTTGNTTKKESDMPYTGTESYIIPLIAVILVLGITSFVGYKNIGK